MNIAMNTDEEKEINQYYDENNSGSVNRHEFILGIRPYLMKYEEYKKKNAYLIAKISRPLKEVKRIVSEDVDLFRIAAKWDYEKVYKKIDKNRDGRISKEEFTNFLMKYILPRVNDQELNDLYDSIKNINSCE